MSDAAASSGTKAAAKTDTAAKAAPPSKGGGDAKKPQPKENGGGNTPKDEDIEEKDASRVPALKEMLGASLLEVMEAQEKITDRISVTRLMYVATFDGSIEDAQAAHVRIWADSAADEKNGFYEGNRDMKLTGWLLLHENCLVHAFECKCEKAVDFMVRLNEAKCTTGLRVLIQSEDCPMRYFGDWTAEKVNASREDYEMDSGQSASDLSWEMYTLVLKMREMQKQTNFLPVMKGPVAKLVPSKEKIAAYVASDHWFDLKDYLVTFADPVFVQLESEKVWPVQKFEKINNYLDGAKFTP